MFETSIIKCVFILVSSELLFQHRSGARQKGSMYKAVAELFIVQCSHFSSLFTLNS